VVYVAVLSVCITVGSKTVRTLLKCACIRGS